MQTNGWLFDLYPLGDRLVLWFITDAGQRLRLEDEFPYCVYLGGPPARLSAITRTLESRGWVRRAYPARGRDLWTGEEMAVLALEVRSYGLLYRLKNWLGALPAGVECYNCDLDVATYYLYVRRLFPCAWYHLEAQGDRLVRLEPLEEAFALEFSPPPLTTLTLSLTRDPLIPLGAGNGLAVGWEGETLELDAPDIPGLLRDLAHRLRRADPDLVLSAWGDEEIIPTLTRWSLATGVRLPLHRETGPVDRKFSGARSYFSYGRIVYQGSAVPFYGRWHLDRCNSFYYREAGLPGLLQISRIGQMPLQRAARASPGTLITSMQLARATADGILIPWRKGEPERFKTAGALLTIDKGGLTFMPPVGLHFNVAEVDFASMYPTIMAIHNISPETVNCSCCAGEVATGGKAVASGQWSVVSEVEPPPPAVPAPALPSNVQAGPVGAQLAAPLGRKDAGRDACVTTPLMLSCRGGSRTALKRPPAFTEPVPEAGYHLCRRREGLVPRTLKPILALREQLKARAKELPPDKAAPYKERQTALKWMLVTCFGYLGYKNARFGRIEAHEAVTAHGRDKLLTAKEISEAAGYTVLHGLTDCLWLQKVGVTDTGWRENDSSFGGTGVSPVRRRLNVHASPGAHPRLMQIPPAPLFQRGVQKSPPLAKGDLGEFAFSAARPAATSNDLWKARRQKAELADLCQKISAATGVKLALEGVYRWLCFMPSRQDPKRPVATRYFGVFADGSLKVRGLALRRRDTPPFVRRAQEALLAKLTEAVTPTDLIALKPELEEIAAGFRQRLREGSVRPQDLVITRVLSQPVADYKVDTPTSLVARQLEAAGLHLQPGEKVRYVHAEKKGGPKETRIQAASFLDTLDDYDVGFYLELLERAIEEVLLILGEKM
ncbi:MAG: DNA polymerase domain-containing protein [Desulfobaccales bacterium]